MGESRRAGLSAAARFTLIHGAAGAFLTFQEGL